MNVIVEFVEALYARCRARYVVKLHRVELNSFENVFGRENFTAEEIVYLRK